MKYGNRYKGGNIEPDGDINMTNPSFKDGAKHVPAENHPDERDQDVNRPF
jgi:hypothetical protein